LRNAGLHQRLEAELASWDDMVSVDGNRSIGSLLLIYDATRTVPAWMEARIEALMADMAGTALVSVKPLSAPSSAPQSRRPTLRRLNRHSKLGMVASLALSLAAVGASKRLHAATGAIYLVMMLIHMATHRRHLFK
jgi:hypothetical protein